MAALFGIGGLAVAALIGGYYIRTIGRINSLLVAGLLGGGAYYLYQRWKDKE